MPKGGRRPGAGRPKGSLCKKKLASVDIATKILVAIDQKKAWMDLMSSNDERIRLEALKYLSDRAYGRPAQSVQLQGDAESFKVVVEHIGA